MDVETRPLWTTEREAMGKTWIIAGYPNDVALGDTDGMGSKLTASTHIRNQLIAVKIAGADGSRQQSLLHELIEMSAIAGGCDIEHPDIERLTSLLFAFLRGFGLWRDFPWPDREPGGIEVTGESGSAYVSGGPFAPIPGQREEPS